VFVIGLRAFDSADVEAEQYFAQKHGFDKVQSQMVCKTFWHRQKQTSMYLNWQLFYTSDALCLVHGV
jgi:hypothetical protein